ncbi:MAG: DUF1599 domain-containing protein [Bacteroidota bacterium]
MSKKTVAQFDEIAAKCQKIFENKTGDYGLAWRILRPSSLTDQIYIKANRIRSIEETKTQKIDEGIEPEFQGIVNYGIMALIQLEKGASDKPDLTPAQAKQLYQKHLDETKRLMINKNHDYGEAWRNMKISSLTDIILMKILRIKQIEENKGMTKVSEGLDANYHDIINYAIFALIKIEESKRDTK